EQAAQVDPALAGVADLGDVPGPVGPWRGLQPQPFGLGLLRLAVDTVDDLLGLAGRVLGGNPLLATSEHVTVLPGRIRPKRIYSHPLCRSRRPDRLNRLRLPRPPRRHDRRWTRSPPRPGPTRAAPRPARSAPSRPAGRPVGQSGRSARTARSRAGRDSPRSP